MDQLVPELLQQVNSRGFKYNYIQYCLLHLADTVVRKIAANRKSEWTTDGKAPQTLKNYCIDTHPQFSTFRFTISITVLMFQTLVQVQYSHNNALIMNL